MDVLKVIGERLPIVSTAKARAEIKGQDEAGSSLSKNCSRWSKQSKCLVLLGQEACNVLGCT